MLKKCDARTNGRTNLCIELRYAQLIIKYVQVEFRRARDQVSSASTLYTAVLVWRSGAALLSDRSIRKQ